MTLFDSLSTRSVNPSTNPPTDGGEPKHLPRLLNPPVVPTPPDVCPGRARLWAPLPPRPISGYDVPISGHQPSRGGGGA